MSGTPGSDEFYKGPETGNQAKDFAIALAILLKYRPDLARIIGACVGKWEGVTPKPDVSESPLGEALAALPRIAAALERIAAAVVDTHDRAVYGHGTSAP